ncbi:hypothetical protein ABUE34_12945 [Kozakia baliensis]|uniref:hypothetical protein n=1 Tax=Kozakia baliensis TaxID=153496 RepID=UPI00345BCE8C
MIERTNTERLERGVDAMIAAQNWRDPRWKDSAIGMFQYERNGKPIHIIRDHETEFKEERTVVIFETVDRELCEATMSRIIMRRLLLAALAAMDAEERG